MTAVVITAVARPDLGPSAGVAPGARRRLRRRHAGCRGLRASTPLEARAAETGVPVDAPDVVALDLVAKRTRALRHALAEYELPAFHVTPGRPLGEILAR